MKTEKSWWAWAGCVWLGIAAAVQGVDPDVGEFSHMLGVTFSGYADPDPLTNFPALVILHEDLAGFDYEQFAAAGGEDLRFFDASLQSLLPHQVERWDTNGTSFVWVQVPELIATTLVFAVWGNADPGLAAVPGTPWDSTYRAVWHLSDTPGPAVDATGQGNDGTPMNGVDQQAVGWIAGGYEFDAASAHYVELSDHVASFAGLSQGTVEAMFRTSAGNQVGSFLSLSDEGDASSEVRLILENTQVWYDFRDGNSAPAGEAGQLQSPSGMTDGQWHHVAVTVDSSSQAVLYLDGEAVASETEPFFGSLTGADQMAMGRNVDSGGPQWLYSGTLDEMRVSSAVRSPSWVRAAAMNQLANALFQVHSTVRPAGNSLLVFIPPDVTVGCNAGTTPADTGQATAVDSCPGAPTITFVDTVVTGTCPTTLTISREWSVTNICGQADSGIQVITVADDVPPVLVPPAHRTIGCGNPTDPAHTGTPMTADNCGGPVTVSFQDDVSGPDCPYLITRTWRAEDACGNLAEAEQRIEVGQPPLTETVLFQSGAAGYHTYRIPAIVRSTNGTLLAFCEGRKNSSSDAGDIDIVLRRSVDGGENWGPQSLVQEEGGGASITIGNPAPVVDEITGTIYLAFCRNNDRVFMTSSSDDGLSWSARMEITDSVKLPTWSWYATGPVHGIQLTRGPRAGRLVIPCDHRVDGAWGSQLIVSDDHGATWTLGGVVSQLDGMHPNECVAVELGNGDVCLNMRNQAGDERLRVIAYSTDGGDAFGAPSTDPVLVTPVVQASALRYSALDTGDATNRVLFSNPATTGGRTRMTVRSSFDETATWNAGKLIHEGPSAYSDLVKLDDGRVGLLYEKGVNSPYETITFARMTLGFLDELPPPDSDPANAFWRLDEAPPGQPADLSPGAIRDTHPDANALHMTAVNPIAYVAGDPRYGPSSALRFTGGQRVRIPDSETDGKLDFGVNDSFTLEAVIKVSLGQALQGAIVAKDVAPDQPSWWFRVQSEKPRFLVADGNGHQPNLFGVSTVNDGLWHHVAAVRDTASHELRVYLDRQLEATTPDTTDRSLANGNAVVIGAFNADGSFFDGDIDRVRITAAALDPAAFIQMADNDADRLPNTWEIAHGLDPDDDGSNDPNQGAAGNADGDALTNWQEYLADTHPRDPASVFEIVAAAEHGNGAVVISIASSSNRVYWLEGGDTLPVPGWDPITNGVPGTGGLLELADPAAASRPSRHYRAGVSLP